MDLERLILSNFRNLGEEEVELPAGGLLVAAAPNATGKTNFLESIVMLLRGKSFRARAEECVSWGKDNFILRGEINRAQSGRSRVAVRYYNPARKLRIEEDGAPASVVAFYSHYPLVLFLPEDTFLLSRGPTQRRNFLNHALVAHPHYLSALVQFHRALRQRNALLKRAQSAEDVHGWTELLAEHAEVLWRHREEFVTYINANIDEMYKRLSGESIEIGVRLQPGASRARGYMEELEEAFGHERSYGYTAHGPHRDDVGITVGGQAARSCLSRGQARSLVIALKVITHRYIKQITKEDPIFLLDDVLSELDEDRQVILLENLPRTQTILTCTTVPEVLQGRDNVYLLDLRSIVGGVKNKKKKGEGQAQEDVNDEPGADEEVSTVDFKRERARV